MKSPSECRQRLARQWHQASVREARLLSGDPWPLALPIGRPSAKAFAENPREVQAHVQAWKAVGVGEVQWQPVNYRAGAEPVSMPVCWWLRTPTEWVAAMEDSAIRNEFSALEQLVGEADERFRSLLIRRRSLWLNKPLDEVISTLRLAQTLTPGCAQGRPLRLLAGHGVDTKFFERNGALLTRLLDERFDGAASEQGLTTLLDALDEGDHWVLVAPLCDGLLPFKRLRVSTSELTNTAVPGTRVLIVENERCLHQLPELPDTVAILGAGLDLQWLGASHWGEKSLAYWGDMDTWGLLMLARARTCQPQLTPLLMNQPLFQRHAPRSAVPEPVAAQQSAPEGLTEPETALYQYLLSLSRGRLEQEYLAPEEVRGALEGWLNQSV
ncbi:DUF3322 domain-containing protein [Marinimicrobium locisalis]|uniref:DUF3322 domain-containing protein n=1 Tax=Marinimicrobium locisalis TaxID=546022 RepID=UPI003221FD9C